MSRSLKRNRRKFREGKEDVHLVKMTFKEILKIVKNTYKVRSLRKTSDTCCNLISMTLLLRHGDLSMFVHMIGKTIKLLPPPKLEIQ